MKATARFVAREIANVSICEFGVFLARPLWKKEQ
jgi:hypothetical protein